MLTINLHQTLGFLVAFGEFEPEILGIYWADPCWPLIWVHSKHLSICARVVSVVHSSTSEPLRVVPPELWDWCTHPARFDVGVAAGIENVDRMPRTTWTRTTKKPATLKPFSP